MLAAAAQNDRNLCNRAHTNGSVYPYYYHLAHSTGAGAASFTGTKLPSTALNDGRRTGRKPIESAALLAALCGVSDHIERVSLRHSSLHVA